MNNHILKLQKKIIIKINYNYNLYIIYYILLYGAPEKSKS